ncbi:MAG TPA: heme o synthase [Candidatus Saccharimonadales bacterium]|nr:heme o synthase [Candidatus Saccharimonadales bacterium]
MSARTLKNYYSLTKPGVLYGNAITAAAGFLFAAAVFRTFEPGLFVALCIGTTLVIASACVINNVLDADIDSKMERTKKRVTVTREVPQSRAVLFGITLGIVGLLILYFYTNLLVVGIGIFGFIDYVALYGMLTKRLSVHGTLVGSISGAMPILAGYCAVSDRLDAGAILVFLALFFWQMPEFYSISIYRHDEYKAAGVPVMSVVAGIRSTKIQIYIYTVLFVACTLLLTILGYTGFVYLFVMAALGGYWLWLAAIGLQVQSEKTNAWARRMFHFSLIMLLAFSAMLPIGALLA